LENNYRKPHAHEQFCLLGIKLLTVCYCICSYYCCRRGAARPSFAVILVLKLFVLLELSHRDVKIKQTIFIPPEAMAISLSCYKFHFFDIYNGALCVEIRNQSTNCSVCNVNIIALAIKVFSLTKEWAAVFRLIFACMLRCSYRCSRL
jgi:hypothetical protein